MDRGNRGRGRGRGDRGGRGSSPSMRGSASSGSRGNAPSGPMRGSYSSGGGGGGRGGGRGGGPVQVFAGNSVPQIDSRLTDKEMNALVSRFKALSTSVPERVIRPGFGKQGAVIALRANFFALNYPKDLVLYDYPIKIEPAVKAEEKRLRRRLFDLFEATEEVAPYLQGIAHDRMQRLIAHRLLPPDFSATFPFYEEGEAGPRPEAKEYTVSLEEPKILSTADLDRYLRGEDFGYDALPIISALNLIVTSHASHTGVLFGRNRYYFPPGSYIPQETAFPLSSGLEAWKGFFASVRPVYKNLMVNVNICMSPFFVPYAKLSDAYLRFQQESRGGNIRSFYRRVRVTTTHLGYRKRSSIKAFGDNPASSTFFQCDELGGRVSVAQYFQKKYNVRLQHATDIPVVNLGNRTKDVFVPAELCEIEPGQTFAGALSERETAEMIKYACNPPYDNANMITGQGLNMLGFNRQASPMEGFGVEISMEMAVVPGRVLNPPRVMYQSGQPNVANGSWNILGVRFAVAASLSRCAVLVLADGGRDDFRDSNDPALNGIIEGFLQKCRNSGMQVEQNRPPPVFVRLPRPNNQRDPLRRDAIDLIEKQLRTLPGRPNLVLVFMSSRDPHIYPGLKKLCDSQLGIHTVCMLNAKVRREKGQDQYFSNIALKVNAKLGGVNHRIGDQSLRWLKDTMLVGMDVTHPGVGCLKGTPSIAAVVASCDQNFINYPASMRLQEHRKEMITDLKLMMLERLAEYNRRQKAYPAKVIVFRDGVSEGQFDQVLLHELPQIREAFRSLKNCKPKLTIAICGKRHHARFYPTRPQDADRTSNTKAGTVVDQGITSVYDFDFYLQAHAGLQGTVRATHYSVIYDEAKMGPDDVQQTTNDVSYLWARATKSVSLVPPAYHADTACERGRMWLHGMYPPPFDSPDRSLDEEAVRIKCERMWGDGVHPNLRSSMFYT